MAWSSIRDYRDSCKRINTRINPAVERLIADRIDEQSGGNRCAWCEIGECLSKKETPIDQDDVDEFNFNNSSCNK
jgi:hypothetical protein